MHMNLFITTFNAQKKPPSTEFTDAVGLKLPADPADLYVFSFQELSSLLDSTYSNIIMDQLTGLAHTIQDMLSLKYSESFFSIDTIEQYGGLGIIIVSPSNSHISNMVSSKGYPVGHLYTTLKGGIGVRLKCNDQELTFVNVHLSAGEKKHHLVKRNKDIYDILSGLEFDDGWSVLKPMGHGFIMGDLNYRNTGAFQLGRCDFANSNELLKDDELTIMRNSNIVLQMYDEAHVGFEPSYKYVVGTDKYNKKRIPSYCDRILYVKGGNYTVFKYDAIKECRSSDHKPVYLYVGVGDPPRDIINNSGYLATNTGRVTVILRWNYKLRKILVHQISAITTYLLSCGLWLNSSRGRIFTLFFLILLMIFWKYIV